MGFTLIELLVVVLIIGILAAVALSQYKTAVDKANFSTMWAVVRALKTEQEMYYLANGTYATSLSDVNSVLPEQCQESPYNCGKFGVGRGIAGGVVYYVYGYLQREKVGVGNALMLYMDQQNDPHPIQCYAYQEDGERGRKLCAVLGGQKLTADNAGCGGNCTRYGL